MLAKLYKFKYAILLIHRSFPNASYVGVYRVLNEPAILLRDLDMIKEIMIKSFPSFLENVVYINKGRDATMLCNPFAAKGEKWRVLRNEFAAIFTPNKASVQQVSWLCKHGEVYFRFRWNSLLLTLLQSVLSWTHILRLTSKKRVLRLKMYDIVIILFEKKEFKLFFVALFQVHPRCNSFSRLWSGWWMLYKYQVGLYAIGRESFYAESL